MIPGFRPGVCLSTAGRSCFPDRHFPRHFADFGNAPRRVEKAEQEIPLESCSAGHELCNVTFRWNVFHSLHCGERLSLARNIDRNVSGPGDPHVRQAGIRGRAYAADATASTPLLSALAQARGIPLSELVERVLAKADAFAVASGSIIGQRQALEDRLDACTTLEEVQGITLVISMLGGETA